VILPSTTTPVLEPSAATLKDSARKWLRKQLWWLQFREFNREGLRPVWRRRRIQRLILNTPPVFTERTGDIEIRVVTWRRDWINLIWALKSFYHFSGVRYPLHIHDGGLLDANVRALLEHFPHAKFVSRADADREVEAALTRLRAPRSLEYRRRSALGLKLFDVFLLSHARTVLSIDSDILFFRRPDELIGSEGGPNLYNKDANYYYCLSLDEIQSRFGIRPIPLINSGLWRVAKESLCFRRIEEWLRDDDLFNDHWLTEQTIHGMCSTLRPTELLPDTYLVSATPGLPAGVVCKHYPGSGRPLMYHEGMAHLIQAGFCSRLRNAPEM
jgi:hypothetical protein